jgi:hypothetical protein
MTWRGSAVHKGQFVVSLLAMAVVSLLAIASVHASPRALGAYTVAAKLNTSAAGKVQDASAATGTLTARLTLTGGNNIRFTWTLSFNHLSGQATRADIYLGAPGKRGFLGLPLCVRCRAPEAHGAYIGPYNAVPRFVGALLNGGAYAVVSTHKNPKGEIRGQIKAKRL